MIVYLSFKKRVAFLFDIIVHNTRKFLLPDLEAVYSDIVLYVYGTVKEDELLRRRTVKKRERIIFTQQL